MSDEALQSAWRAACAAPDDAQVRRAYAAQLERIGHRAAAFVERSMAGLLDGSPAPEPPLSTAPEDRAERRLVAPLPWPKLDVVPPERDDAHLAGAGLIGPEAAILGLSSAPVALVPWPSCRAGCAQGSVECEACGGRGSMLEFTGRAEERVPCDRCGGNGLERCGECEGWDLSPPVHHGCGHQAPWQLEGTPRRTRTTIVEAEPSSAVTWSLLRCPTCGLAMLRRHPEEDDYPACPECGRFRCVCGIAGA